MRNISNCISRRCRNFASIRRIVVYDPRRGGGGAMRTTGRTYSSSSSATSRSLAELLLRRARIGPFVSRFITIPVTSVAINQPNQSRSRASVQRLRRRPTRQPGSATRDGHDGVADKNVARFASTYIKRSPVNPPSEGRIQAEERFSTTSDALSSARKMATGKFYR